MAAAMGAVSDAVTRRWFALLPAAQVLGMDDDPAEPSDVVTA